MAAAGVDASNVEPGHVVLLPEDPDASARALRAALAERAGVNVAVLVTDTAGRAWREGQTDIAIGAAGLGCSTTTPAAPTRYGNPLDVTAPAVADELAGAAELAAGQARPAAVRGRARAGRPGAARRRRRARRRRPGAARGHGPVRATAPARPSWPPCAAPGRAPASSAHPWTPTSWPRCSTRSWTGPPRSTAEPTDRWSLGDRRRARAAGSAEVAAYAHGWEAARDGAVANSVATGHSVDSARDVRTRSGTATKTERPWPSRPRRRGHAHRAPEGHRADARAAEGAPSAAAAA